MANNNISFEGSSSSTSSTISMANRDIHVLLVEHDHGHHANAKQMLEYFFYKVTAVKLASTALSMISNGKTQLDAVIANANSPDSYGFKLVQDASKMGILVILLSDEDDLTTTMRALEEGAFLCIKKPIQVHMVMYLWQHVAREKTRSLYRDIEQIIREDPLKGCVMSEEDISRNLRGNPRNDVMYQKKVWTEWTQELHDKFIAAIRTLGEGRCYPKDILELMNVPGLTRMQVASHLQKCRGGKWQPPKERKSRTNNNNNNNNKEIINSLKNKRRRAKPMRFGTMPFRHDDCEAYHENPNNHHQAFGLFQTKDQSCVLETGVYNSVVNTRFTDQQEYHQHFAADQSQNNYNHSITHIGSEDTFNVGQLGSNNFSKEPFDQLFDFPTFMQSSNSSNQSNVHNAEDAFKFVDSTMAQNLSSLQLGFGVMNNSGIGMQAFVFGQAYYDQNQVTECNY